MRIASPRFQIMKAFSRAIAIVLLTGGVCQVRAFAQTQEASEYEVKALFLYNFAKFVDWPPETSWQSNDPMTICVVGEDPFGPLLDGAVRGKSIGSHRLVVQRYRSAQGAKGCQIAFISASEKKRLRSVLSSLGGTGVLTVGETEGFAAMGGVINLVIEEGRVHFEVNVDAAERARLKISSKLLSLAKIIRDQNKKGGN